MTNPFESRAGRFMGTRAQPYRRLRSAWNDRAHSEKGQRTSTSGGSSNDDRRQPIETGSSFEELRALRHHFAGEVLAENHRTKDVCGEDKLFAVFGQQGLWN